MRRTAPVQSPVPVAGGPRLSLLQRVVVGLFVTILALGYVVQLLPAMALHRAGVVAREVQGAP